MIRLTALAALLAGMFLSMSACTNTVRGLGADLNNPDMQNYNSRTVADVDH
jgi:predicted small secreted protein